MDFQYGKSEYPTELTQLNPKSELHRQMEEYKGDFNKYNPIFKKKS